MNYEPFSSDPNGNQRWFAALAKHFAHFNTEQARLRRHFGASHEAIDQTVRSEGMGTREALATIVSLLQGDVRMLARRVDGGNAEILQEVRELRSQMNSVASVLAYHARIDPRDYEQEDENPANLV